MISGGQFNKDVLKPKEVVSLLLDDVELEAKCMLISFNIIFLYYCWFQEMGFGEFLMWYN